MSEIYQPLKDDLKLYSWFFELQLSMKLTMIFLLNYKANVFSGNYKETNILRPPGRTKCCFCQHWWLLVTLWLSCHSRMIFSNASLNSNFCMWVHICMHYGCAKFQKFLNNQNTFLNWFPCFHIVGGFNHISPSK